MKTDIENVLRSIEVAVTKLQLLRKDNPGASTLAGAEKLLANAHAILKNPDSTNGSAMASTNTASTDSSPAEFTRIKNIDPPLAAKLKDIGIESFSEIAAWREDDIAKISTTLSLGTRISRENWVEQAAILAKGNETDYSRTRPASAPVDKPQEISTTAANSPEDMDAASKAPSPNTEIIAQTNDPGAYPNPDEDPSEVVKRFMNALTGNKDEEFTE